MLLKKFFDHFDEMPGGHFMRFNLQNFQSLKRIKFEVEMQLGGIVMCIFDLTKYLKLSENAIRKTR